MNNFSYAMQNVVSPDTTTENGLPAYSQSNSALVDLYYRMIRNISKKDLEELLVKAWAANPLATTKLIFQARDCRGGKGDKDSFKLAFQWLIENHIDTAAVNLHLLPEYGYWKDLINYFKSESTDLATASIAIYKQALESENRLAFKYAPRPGKSLDWAAKILRKALKLSEKEYRKFLKEGTTVVESQMCANQWEKITYSSVPSKAHKNYKNAFVKHTEERYNQYLTEIAEGKSTIKASQLYPYELLKEYKDYKSTQNQTTNLQWAELVNKIKQSGVLSAALPVVDVSGSMCTEVAKGVEAIEISKALGLLISEVVAPPWNNLLINFSSQPLFFELKGNNLFERYKEIKTFERHEGYNTNFLAVFKLILKRAIDHKLTQEELPKIVIALSDCQFNDSYLNNQSAQQVIKDLYKIEGYEPPILVFWNLNGRYNNFPATSREGNVILLSGFSPSALSYLLTKGIITPEAIVEDIITSAKYEAIKLK